MKDWKEVFRKKVSIDTLCKRNDVSGWLIASEDVDSIESHIQSLLEARDKEIIKWANKKNVGLIKHNKIGVARALIYLDELIEFLNKQQ